METALEEQSEINSLEETKNSKNIKENKTQTLT